MAMKLARLDFLTKQKQLMIRSLQQKSPMKNHLRSLIIPPPGQTKDTPKMFTEVFEETQKKVCVGGDNCPIDFLSSIVPPSQDALPPRTMQDSFTQVLIPIGSNPSVHMKYTSHIGGVRLGRLE